MQIGFKRRHVPLDIPVHHLKFCATLSKLAYKRPGSIDIVQNVSGGEITRICNASRYKGKYPIFINGYPKEDAQIYMWLLKDEVKKLRFMYLCFRGDEHTNAMINTIDTNPVLVDIKNDDSDDDQHMTCKVHPVFYRQYESIETELLQYLHGHTHEYDTIVCCGHGTGGALATIAAPLLAVRFKEKDVYCYTYGSPRVGNAKFCRWFKRLVAGGQRVVNEEDPIPLMPSSFIYQHVSNGVCLTSDEKYEFIQGDTPWYLRWLLSAKKFQPGHFLPEHDCKRYIDRLASIKENKKITHN